MNTLIIAVFLTAVVMIFTYWKTITSGMSKDRKLALYIITFVMPVLGLMLYFVFEKQNKKEVSVM